MRKVLLLAVLLVGLVGCVADGGSFGPGGKPTQVERTGVTCYTSRVRGGGYVTNCY